MSFISEVTSGFSKAISFLSVVLTKEQAVNKTITSLAPTTKAALLATFYDVVKTVQSAETVAATAATGNVAGAITLSAGTVAMIQTVLADGKTDVTTLANIVTALKADVA